MPCSLKQKALRCIVRKAEVVFWWANGLYAPVHSYCPSIGEGTLFIRKLRSTWASSSPHFTSTSPESKTFDLGITVVIRCGSFSLNSNALLSMICTQNSNGLSFESGLSIFYLTPYGSHSVSSPPIC